jgi:hypothetical protein
MAGLVPAIHVVQPHRQFALRRPSPRQRPAARKRNRVDGRDKPGHDGIGAAAFWMLAFASMMPQT